MKTMMTVAEVVQTAFGDAELPEGVLSEQDVRSAQLRHLAPALGRAMYGAVLEGRYAELADEWLKPALALFVKAAVLPSLMQRVGAAGVVRYGGETFEAAYPEYDPAEDVHCRTSIAGGVVL